MREIFLGDLSHLKLLDILKTLLVEKKTGVLVMKGREEGEIYVERGNIVHARIARFSGEEGFLAVVGLRTGKATFRPDVVTGEKTIAAPAEHLLLKWSQRRQEWAKIREIVPSPGSVFRLSLQQTPVEKKIRADHWNILALANGMRTVSEMAEAIGWDEFKMSTMICQLVEAGLLEKAEDQKPLRKRRVGEEFFPSVEYELKKVMGPVAPFIIEDKLAEFGESKDLFPQDQAELFVELLSEEIPNEVKKREFVKAMAQVLSGEN